MGLEHLYKVNGVLVLHGGEVEKGHGEVADGRERERERDVVAEVRGRDVVVVEVCGVVVELV